MNGGISPQDAFARRHSELARVVMLRPASYRALVILTLLTVCIAAAAAIALVRQVLNHVQSSAASTHSALPQVLAATPSNDRALMSWLRTNVSLDTAIVADPLTTVSLRTAGYHRASDDVTACRGGALIFVSTAASAPTPLDPALQGCIDHSFEIASLGAAQVRVVPSDTTSADHAQATALANQKSGGAAISNNPAITMSSAARADVRAGRLDLRAEAVLAEVAAHVPVHLLKIEGVPAEAAAGMPARTVEIGVPNTSVVYPLLKEVIASYRPERVAQAGLHSLRITWSFRAEPPLVVD